jgi:hypothetical protein
MATAAQRIANHANAQHSTGPRTVAGKAASARNALSHGLAAKNFVVLPGESDHFQEFLTGLEADIEPESPLEADLFLQFVHAAWTLRRCRAAEVALQAALTDPACDIMVETAAFQRLQNIDLYTRRAQRAYYRALTELRKLQTERTYRGCANALTQNLPRESREDGSVLIDTPSISPAVEKIAVNSMRAKIERLSFESTADEALLDYSRRMMARERQTNPPNPQSRAQAPASAPPSAVNPASRTAARA